MALVRPVLQRRGPVLDIRLRDHVEQIWQRALARRYRPCEFVSGMSLAWWTW